MKEREREREREREGEREGGRERGREREREGERGGGRERGREREREGESERERERERETNWLTSRKHENLIFVRERDKFHFCELKFNHGDFIDRSQNEVFADCRSIDRSMRDDQINDSIMIAQPWLSPYSKRDKYFYPEDKSQQSGDCSYSHNK